MSKVRSQIRVLLVDDHQVVRAGLRAIMADTSDIVVVGEAENSKNAIEATKRLKPDVILMDIRLPDDTGLSTCRKIHQFNPDVCVLILTSFIDNKLVLEALDVGASGYLLKETDGEDLIKAIRTAASGISIFDPRVSLQVLSNVKVELEAEVDNELSKLSPQEKNVLSQVALGKTNKEIALELEISGGTVRNHLSNIMNKLRVTRRSQAVALYVQYKSNS